MGVYRFVGLGVLTAKAQAAVRLAVAESAEDLVGQAQAITPVGPTGHLKAGIHVKSIGGGAGSVTATVATGGESSEYAFFVHDGTTRMAARPFLADALTANTGLYVEAMRRAAAGEF